MLWAGCAVLRFGTDFYRGPGQEELHESLLSLTQTAEKARLSLFPSVLLSQALPVPLVHPARGAACLTGLQSAPLLPGTEPRPQFPAHETIPHLSCLGMGRPSVAWAPQTLAAPGARGSTQPQGLVRLRARRGHHHRGRNTQGQAWGWWKQARLLGSGKKRTFC